MSIGDSSRASPPVVRQPGDDEVVVGLVAERGFRDVRGVGGRGGHGAGLARGPQLRRRQHTLRAQSGRARVLASGQNTFKLTYYLLSHENIDSDKEAEI